MGAEPLRTDPPTGDGPAPPLEPPPSRHPSRAVRSTRDPPWSLRMHPSSCRMSTPHSGDPARERARRATPSTVRRPSRGGRTPRSGGRARHAGTRPAAAARSPTRTSSRPAARGHSGSGSHSSGGSHVAGGVGHPGGGLKHTVTARPPSATPRGPPRRASSRIDGPAVEGWSRSPRTRRRSVAPESPPWSARAAPSPAPVHHPHPSRGQSSRVLPVERPESRVFTRARVVPRRGPSPRVRRDRSPADRRAPRRRARRRTPARSP